jgi:hypothetical protein
VSLHIFKGILQFPIFALMPRKKIIKQIKDSLNELVQGEDMTFLQRLKVTNETEDATIMLGITFVNPESSSYEEQLALIRQFMNAQYGEGFVYSRAHRMNYHQRYPTEPRLRIGCSLLIQHIAMPIRIELMKLLIAIAYIDGYLSARDHRLLMRVGGYMEIEPTEIEDLIAAGVPANNIIGMGELLTASTLPKLRAAYRRLILRYHPDRNPQENTEETFRNIQRMYERICASRFGGG